MKGGVFPLEAKVFRDVTVVPYAELLYHPSGSFHRGGPIWPDWKNAGFARHWVQNRQLDTEPAWAEAASATKGGHYFWGGAICPHFGHQIMDFSMRLAPSRALDPDASFVFASLPKSPVPDAFHDILSWFDVAPSQVIFIDKPERFRRLHVVPQAERRETYGPSKEHLDLMDRFVRTKNLQPPRLTAPLFVSRGGQLIRFAGEWYLEKVIKLAGGVVFRPEEHSIRTQIETYLGADRIVFSEGSAMHLTSLAGRGFRSIDVLVRRVGRHWSTGEAFIRPRAAELRYIDVIKGNICGVNRAGGPGDTAGIPVFDVPKLIEYLESIGIGASKIWSAAAYQRVMGADIRGWLRLKGTIASLRVPEFAASVRKTLVDTLSGDNAALLGEALDYVQVAETTAGKK